MAQRARELEPRGRVSNAVGKGSGRAREGLVLQPWPLAGCAEPGPTPRGAPGAGEGKDDERRALPGSASPRGSTRGPPNPNPSKHTTGTSRRCWTLHCKGQHKAGRPHRAPALRLPKSSSPALPAFRDFLGHSVRPGHLGPAPRGLWQRLEAAGSAGEGLGGTTREPLFSAAPAPRRHHPGAAGVRQRGLAADPESEPVTQPHRCWLQFRATITY